VDGTGSRSCPKEDFDVSGDEPLDCTTREIVRWLVSQLVSQIKGKGKVPVLFTEHYAMKEYWGVEV
jgi:hypothetical protein